MLANEIKVYINADGSLKDENTGHVGAFSNLTNRLTVVSPTSSENVVQATFKLANKIVIEKKYMRLIGTEEVEVAPTIVETWNVFAYDIGSAILSAASDTRSEPVKCQIYFSNIQQDPDSDKIFEGLFPNYNSLTTSTPDATTDSYGGVGERKSTATAYTYDGATWNITNPEVTVQQYEIDNDIINTNLRDTSVVFDIPVEAGIEADGEDIDVTVTDTILSNQSANNSAIQDINNVLGVDGVNFIKSDLKNVYEYITDLDGNNDVLAIQGQNGIKKIRLSALLAGNSKDQGQYDTFADLIAAHPEAIPTPADRAGWSATVVNDLGGGNVGNEITEEYETMTYDTNPTSPTFNTWFATGERASVDRDEFDNLEDRVEDVETATEFLSTDAGKSIFSSAVELNNTLLVKGDVTVNITKDIISVDIVNATGKVIATLNNHETRINAVEVDKLAKDFRTFVDVGTGNLVDSDLLVITRADGTNLKTTWADLKNAIADPFYKGYYPTSNDLLTKYPNGIQDPTLRAGWSAIVGATDSLWIWDVEGNAWVNSATGGNVSQSEFNAYKSTTDGRLDTLESGTEKIAKKGVVDGYAPLDENGQVPDQYIPSKPFSGQRVFFNFVTPGTPASNGIMTLSKPIASDIPTILSASLPVGFILLKQFTYAAINDLTIDRDLALEVSFPVAFITTTKNYQFRATATVDQSPNGGGLVTLFEDRLSDIHVGGTLNATVKINVAASDLVDDLVIQPGDILNVTIDGQNTSSTTGDVDITFYDVNDPALFGGLFGDASTPNTMKNTEGTVQGLVTNQEVVNNAAAAANNIDGDGLHYPSTNPQAADILLDLPFNSVAVGAKVSIKIPDALIDNGQIMNISVDNGLTYKPVKFSNGASSPLAVTFEGEYITVVDRGTFYQIAALASSVENLNFKIQEKLDISDFEIKNAKDVEGYTNGSLMYINDSGIVNFAPLLNANIDNAKILSASVPQVTDNNISNEVIVLDVDNGGNNIDYTKVGNAIETLEITNNTFEVKGTLKGINTNPNNPITVTIKLFRNNVDTGFFYTKLLDTEDTHPISKIFVEQFSSADTDLMDIKISTTAVNGARSVEHDLTLSAINEDRIGGLIIPISYIEDKMELTENKTQDIEADKADTDKYPSAAAAANYAQPINKTSSANLNWQVQETRFLGLGDIDQYKYFTGINAAGDPVLGARRSNNTWRATVIGYMHFGFMQFDPVSNDGLNYRDNYVDNSGGTNFDTTDIFTITSLTFIK